MNRHKVLAYIGAFLLTSCAPSYVSGTANTATNSSSESAGALTLGFSSSTVAENGYLQFTASGGVSPYSYVVESGGGSIDGAGYYTAPSTAGLVEVAVMDSAGNTAYAEITVSNGSTSSSTSLALNATSVTVAASSIYGASTYTFSATGGVSPYSYFVISPTAPAGGTMVASTGVYTAPTESGQTVQVGVEDSDSHWAYATVTITSSNVTSTNLCTTNWGCASALGLSYELDGGAIQSAEYIANEACISKGYAGVYDFSTEIHSISCGDLYGIEDWNGSAFYHNQVALCGNGYVQVVSYIDCASD